MFWVREQLSFFASTANLGDGSARTVVNHWTQKKQTSKTQSYPVWCLGLLQYRPNVAPHVARYAQMLTEPGPTKRNKTKPCPHHCWNVPDVCFLVVCLLSCFCVVLVLCLFCLCLTNVAQQKESVAQHSQSTKTGARSATS